MPISQKKLLQVLRDAFPDGDVKLEDTVGDNDHYSVYIKSRQFNERTKVQQHKMVYSALSGFIGSLLHAIQIKTEEKYE